MISGFKLKAGRSPGVSPEEITATPITVFVGPNNSGKSKVLAEILQYCSTGAKNAAALVLDEMRFSGIPASDLDNVVRGVVLPAHPGEVLYEGNIFTGSPSNRFQVSEHDLRAVLLRPDSNVRVFCDWFLRHQTQILDGRTRIDLIADQPGGDLQGLPLTSFQSLFRDDLARREVRRIVEEALGSHCVIDPTNMGVLRLRLSDRPPHDDREERGVHAEAVEFHAAATLVSAASDGVKAFIGIIVGITAGDPRVLLIDEPEAFLHPSLASKLAFEIARLTKIKEKRVFVSTHSPAFVMGCIQSGAPVNIVRLTYRGRSATARVLPCDELTELMRHPLLRSTGVLSGLFYEFVIVTESDADRAFYQEINERILQFRPDRGIANCLFINAQNKQTIQNIIRPLRKLGIPAVAILDVDIIKTGGSDFTNLLVSADFPELSRQSIAQLRSAVKAAMDETGRDMKRDGGVNILAGGARRSAEDLLEQLSDYGVFVLPGGELESWLPNLKVSGHGPSWLIKIFEKLGSDPEDPEFVRPAIGDVWDFIERIKAWLVNPHRKGIPE